MLHSKLVGRKQKRAAVQRSEDSVPVLYQLKEGGRDGFPIGLGYLAVAFSLGIAARNAGLSPFQGFLGSLLTNASAGEYAAFTLIAAGAPYAELFLVTLIINARYFLMSCALSQRFNPETPFIHRLLVGFDITDELFSITISRPGYLSPWYVYGAILVSAPCWAIGTALGIITGNLLSARVVSALSVALFGMFLAAIIPPARKNKVIAVLILVSFAASFAAAYFPLISNLSAGARTILLTIILSAAAACFCPVSQEGEGNDEP
ncbi:MAG: AzlC family ABC transporter permease [Lachnospiraceae bacterium]